MKNYYFFASFAHERGFGWMTFEQNHPDFDFRTAERIFAENNGFQNATTLSFQSIPKERFKSKP